VIHEQRRLFGVGYDHVGLLQGLAVEGAEVARHGRSRPFARAEAFLTPDVEGDPRLGLAVGPPEEAHKTAEMVVVAVAQHERVQRRGVDPAELDVVQQRLGREAEVHHHVSGLAAAL
jgi:hypothetical protein